MAKHIFLGGVSRSLDTYFVELVLPGFLPSAHAERYAVGSETSLAVLGPVRAAS